MIRNSHSLDLPERIKSLRESLGESQQELADVIGVKRETVKFWESGDRQIKAGDIVNLAEHFNVSADYLLGLSSEQTTNAEIKAVCKYTGLSEMAVYYIRDIYKAGYGQGLNALLGSFFFSTLCEKISEYLVSVGSLPQYEDKGAAEELLAEFCALHPDLTGKVKFISNREYLDQKLNEIADYLKMTLSIEAAQDLYGAKNVEANNE